MFKSSYRKILTGLVSTTLFSTVITTGVVASEITTHNLIDSEGNPVINTRLGGCVRTPNTPNVPAKSFQQCHDIADRDGDGVPDNEDECPDNTPQEISKGVYDDQTPPRRSINRPPQQADDQIGCPIDTDGDTVRDFRDVCINTVAELVAEDRRRGIGTCIHMSGNRIGCGIDRDGDGTPDCFDNCPDPNKDTDGDGIADCFDQCPGTPYDVTVDERGCGKIGDTQILVLQGDVTFAFDKSVLTPQARTTLTDLVNKTEIQFVKSIEVVGHTDSVGREQYNQALSEKRAASVAKYLIQLGVPTDKMTQRGEGERNPVAPNSTKIGRAKNRRVEIKITHFEKKSQD